MTQLTPISQKSFIRGLNASTGRQTQPKGTIPRLTNLLFTKRGTLATVDGTSATFQPNIITNTGIYALGAFLDTHQQTITAPALCGLLTGIATPRRIGTPPSAPTAVTQTVPATPIAAAPLGAINVNSIVTFTTTAAHPYTVGQLVVVSGVTDGTFNGTFNVIGVPSTTQFTVFNNNANVSSGGGQVNAGALNPATTYFYKIAAVDSSGAIFQGTLPMAGVGVTLPSPELAAGTPGGANNAFKLTWTTVRSAAGYWVYRSTTTGTEVLASGYIPNTNPEGPISFVDLGGSIGATSPVGADSSRVASFISISQPTFTGLYGVSNIISDFPYGDGTRAAPPIYGFYDATGGVFSDAWSPYGGTVGTTSAIPQIVPFTDQVAIILGNSYPPYLFDGTKVTQIASTFKGAFPPWATSTFYAVGNLIQPTAPNGHYFKCIQAGTTTGVEPAWTTVSGQQYFSGPVIFQEAGLVNSTSPPPPGAAHAISYAGSLWVGNTYPINNANGIDGPSALRMSDSNNPNSWNPINTAFLSKDDGTQITGMATFTIAESGIIPTGSLVVFKEFSTYQITGVFGATDFSIQTAQTDLGCIAARSIQFIPGFGIVRLTHLGWAVFDGVRDKLLSEEIRPYVFSDPAAPDIIGLDWGFAYKIHGFQTAAPAAYCVTYADLSSGVGTIQTALLFDLVLRAWTYIKWPTPVLTGFQVRALDGLPVTYVTDNIGNINRWQAGDEQWYTGGGGGNGPPASLVPWSVRTPEADSGIPSGRFYLRRLIVRGTNTASAAANFTTPTTQLRFNRSDALTFTALQRNLPAGSGGTEFELDVGIHQIVTSVDCLISGSGKVELDGFDWFVAKKPAGIPVTIT